MELVVYRPFLFIQVAKSTNSIMERKEDFTMILFIILTTILLGLVVMALFTAAVGGTVILAVFGDLIVFILMITIIVKLIKKIRRR